MTMISNLYNVCGFIWSLTLIMLCVILCSLQESNESTGLKKLCGRAVLSTAIYLLGMLLILTGIGILAAIGFLLHIASQLICFVGMCSYLTGFFNIRERLSDKEKITDGAAAAAEAAGKTAAGMAEFIKNKASCLKNNLKADTENRNYTENENTDAKDDELTADDTADITDSADTADIVDAADSAGSSDAENDVINEKTENTDNGDAVKTEAEGNIELPAEGKQASETPDNGETGENPDGLSEEDRVIYDFFNTPESLLGKRILVADTDTDETDKIKEIFRWTDADIVTVDSGADAIELCRELCCDMLIIDHRLRDFDGISAYNMIKRDEQGINGYTPGIALTSENKFSRDKYIKCGFKEVLYKPFEANNLRKAVYEVLIENNKQVTKQSTDDEKLKYLEHNGVRVRMGLTNEGNDAELYIFLLKNFRDSSAMREDKLDRFVEELDSGEEVWDFMLSQVNDLRKEVSELGNNELGELFDTIARYIRAEDIESIKNRMPLVKNMWHGFISILSVL